ncbi:12526_t:CDS:2, partial [Gigaspora margarita]
MDSLSEPVNHKDTLVSPSTDVNENDLDCVVIPDISLQKRKLYTNDASREVGNDVLELSSEETVSTEMNNAFDLIRPQKQKNTNHNNDTPNISVGSSNTATRKKTVKTGDLMTALWRHLNIKHKYTKNSMQQ